MIEGVEYTVNRGDVLVRELNENPYILTPTHRHIISAELEYMENEWPDALKALELRYHNSRQNRMFFEFQIVRQWIKCHFGQSDEMLDIDENGNRNFEPCYCPKRGECESCDLFRVCYPVRSTKLTKSEISVLRLFVAGFDETQIADTLCNSVNTVKKHRMNMLKRLGLHKTTQLIEYWHTNKLK